MSIMLQHIHQVALLLLTISHTGTHMHPVDIQNQIIVNCKSHFTYINCCIWPLLLAGSYNTLFKFGSNFWDCIIGCVWAARSSCIAVYQDFKQSIMSQVRLYPQVWCINIVPSVTLLHLRQLRIFRERQNRTIELVYHSGGFMLEIRESQIMDSIDYIIYLQVYTISFLFFYYKYTHFDQFSIIIYI